MGQGCDGSPSASSRTDVGTCSPPTSCSPTQGLTVAGMKLRFAVFTSFQRTGKPCMREGRTSYTAGTNWNPLRSSRLRAPHPKVWVPRKEKSKVYPQQPVEGAAGSGLRRQPSVQMYACMHACMSIFVHNHV